MQEFKSGETGPGGGGAASGSIFSGGGGHGAVSIKTSVCDARAGRGLGGNKGGMEIATSTALSGCRTGRDKFF